MSKLQQISRICLDLGVFVCVCFAEFALFKWFKPFKRGFFCGDESLQYPFRENTISAKLLISVVLSVPTLLILIGELFRRPESESKKLHTKPGGCHIQRRLSACYKQIGCYLFGLAFTLVATEVGKRSTGRLRPHFFAVCQPELPDGSTCMDAKNHGIYIEQYSCRGENSTAHMLQQLGHSFPSGHASLFFYSMLYTAFYLQTALTSRVFKLLKHALQFACVMFAWFVALSRIGDNWHHWSDVLVGSLLGVLVAVVVALFLANMFVLRRITVTSGSGGAEMAKVAKAAPPALPAYMFGGVPYLHNQYGQPYHNYAYVP